VTRLGELLVTAKLLSPDQVEQALRAQIVWGVRIGTNLVELGFIDLDGLSRALGRQRRLPAALQRHFDKADRELQKRLEPEQADRWSIVPLLRVGPAKIAIAVMDPLDAKLRAAIAEAFGVAPRDIVASIAAEQRIKYQLEHVYGIARSARFLRTKGPAATPFPQLGEVPDEGSDPDLAAVAVPEPVDLIESGPSDAVPEVIASHGDVSAAPDVLEQMIDEAAHSAVPRATDEEPSGRERRSYVRTLADLEPGEKALARIAIRKVATGRIQLPGEEQETPATLADATRAIRRGRDRDDVAAQVMAALDRFAPACDGAALMIVRGEVVIAWRSFCRTGQIVSEIAVPLTQEGLVPAVVQGGETARGNADDLGAIDLLLLRSLGKHEGDLVIVPVAIKRRVVALIAAALSGDAGTGVIETVAQAASVAFGRLMRDASR